MTITYSNRVSNARFGGFYRLLSIWKGGIFKLFYGEFLVFILLYFIFSLTYRLFLSEDQRRQFEKASIYCNKYSSLIPVSIVLPIYIILIVERWWNQYQSIPRPDRLMCVISGTVEGADETGRLYRRTLMRYCSLSALLILRSVSIPVYKRFPTLDHVVKTGFMTRLEKTKFDALPSRYNKYWIPCVWFCNLVVQARSEGRVRDDPEFQLLMEELNAFRNNCAMLFHYDWISVPLVYTQVVTIAVYSFFSSCLIGRQYLDPARNITGHELDLYVPMFTLLEFFFFGGWLKVAEHLINPFGEDDDDFESNFLIDRNFQVAMLAVDKMHLDLPLMEKDRHWNVAEPCAPYEVGTVTRRDSYLGSTFHMFLDEEDMQYQPRSAIGRQRNRFSSVSFDVPEPLQQRLRSFQSFRLPRPRPCALIEEPSEESSETTPRPDFSPPPSPRQTPPPLPTSDYPPSTPSPPQTPSPTLPRFRRVFRGVGPSAAPRSWYPHK
ncbi:bestrophin-2-like [Ascaphus truei]|uniref:bestrophin-2-like n=1 Tax=Ascaphus truei TaxID=8439 RepID=UPI003F5A8168